MRSDHARGARDRCGAPSRTKALQSLFRPDTRRAFVAPSAIAFGLARMFGMYAELASQTIAVFRSLDEAVRWLGLESTGMRTRSTSREQSGGQLQIE